MAHFTESHAIRKKILKKIDEFNKYWENRHADFLNRLQGEVGTTELDCTRNNTPSCEVDGQGHDATNEQENGADVDWEEIVELDPSSKPLIDQFLASRRIWNDAEAKFLSSAQEIQEKTKEHHASILRVVEYAYVQIFEDISSLQEEIQHCMIENFHKRAGLEASLQEAAEKQKSMFARLIESVTGRFPKTGSAQNNASGQKRKQPIV